MYAGTTFGSKSGHVIGVHQRIDRVARRHLTQLMKPKQTFPTIAQILHFEGNNGPDGIKRKSPSKDEPWHYIDPNKLHDRTLVEIINGHQVNLAQALKEKNIERASFEAAWLAHAIVDGLTPAHHYPLGDKIEELFGIPHYERLTVKDKNVIKGKNKRDTIAKNWEYWGGGGIFSTHFLFEFGVASAILGRRFPSTVTKKDIKMIKDKGYETYFMEQFHYVTKLQTYEDFTDKGWNWQLGKTVQKELIPTIMKAVCLGWYTALLESEK